MEGYSILEIILIGVFIISVIGSVIIIISENGNPIRTLAWVLVLICLPVIGLACYYFFGQDTHKIKRLTKRYFKRTKTLSISLFDSGNVSSVPDTYRTLATLLQKNNNSSILHGSKVEIITKGERKFEALMEDMKNAKHHIHMEYFIFTNDETGNMVKEMLMKKAEEGVEVRFMYDNVANWTIPARYYNEMKDSGVRVSSFMKVKLAPVHSKVNFRNHRKVVVIDGNIGYIGGMNVANEYNTGPNWRDTHMRVVGNGVHGLQINFLIDWRASGESLVADKVYFPENEIYTQNLMQIVTGGPVFPWQSLMQATLHIITNAKKYVYIQTPYFLPTEALFEALQVAVLGGVDVRLMVSQRSDSPYVDPAAHSYYEALLNSGLKIYELQGTFIHAKSMVADDYISVLGSANFDFRSFETNFEINSYMYDKDVALQMKEIFMNDAKDCKEVILKEWMKRPWYKKFLESLMKLFSPLM